ncbi:MAG: HpcH/HpaI aldolase/citrate lyase family protein [Ilumatobacter sp.]
MTDATLPAGSLPGLGTPGKPTFGTWVKLPTLETLELLAHAGLDFVVIDLEHSPLTLESAYMLVVVAQSMDMVAFVRVPDRSGSHVQRVLDAGADGILVPQVTSVEQAEQAIAQMTFAPKGVRGMGITSRAGRWGLLGKAYLRTDDRVVKAIQVEDLATLQNIEPLLDLPGLSAAFIGMGDLTMSSGLASSSAEIGDAVDELINHCHRRSLPLGTAVGDAALAAQAVEQGYSFILVSNDTTMFAKTASQLGTDLAALRRGSPS